MPKKVYVAPTITTIGSIHGVTLVNKYATLSPDGIIFHPTDGSPIALTS